MYVSKMGNIIILQLRIEFLIIVICIMDRYRIMRCSNIILNKIQVGDNMIVDLNL